MHDVTRAASIDRFLSEAGWGNAERIPLVADASFRRYFRLVDRERHAMLMDAPPPYEDVRPWVTVGRHLSGMGFGTPRILAADRRAGLLIIEDFGEDTYSRLIAAGAAEAPLYALAIDTLTALHRNADAANVEVPPYDDRVLLEEALLLTDWYMPAVLRAATPERARAAYLDAWRAVLPAAREIAETLVLRDYHIDNLMLLPGRSGVAACGLLDFQDALVGPIGYDLVSLLQDARRDIDPGLAAAMRARYLAAFPGLDVESFDRSCAILSAQRHAKVIGIFTRLFARDGKPVYLKHIPRVWRLLEASLLHPALRPVATWVDEHIPPSQRTVPAPQ